MTNAEIAHRLKRATSTIGREIRRNAQREEDYWYEYAQRDSEERLPVAHQRPHQRTPALHRYVEGPARRLVTRGNQRAPAPES